MPRRPLRQLLNEAREAEKSRRSTPAEFDNWLSVGLGSKPDQRTKEALYSFDLGTLSIQYDFPALAEVPVEVDNRAAYIRVLAEMALRCVHHSLAQDQRGAIEFIVFDGFVDTVDLSTGRDIRPSLIHFEVTRKQFLALDLTRVDPMACLRGLQATIALEQPASSFWAI